MIPNTTHIGELATFVDIFTITSFETSMITFPKCKFDNITTKGIIKASNKMSCMLPNVLDRKLKEFVIVRVSENWCHTPIYSTYPNNCTSGAQHYSKQWWYFCDRVW